jgi:hypothetical protein
MDKEMKGLESNGYPGSFIASKQLIIRSAGNWQA